MCIKCNVKKGESEILMDEFIDITVGKRSLEPHCHSVMIKHTMNDEWFIGSYYFMDDEPISSLETKILYCPFCGRKLSEH